MDKLFIGFLGLMFLVGGVTCLIELKGSGDVTSYLTGSGTENLKIIGLRGQKVIMQITELNFNPGSYLTVRDGKNGANTKYSVQWGRIKKTTNGRTATVSLPINIVTMTRKLFIYHHVSGGRAGEGFTAHYTTFNEEGSCPKEGLQSLYENSTNIVCDTDELSPVASQCEVTYDCGDKSKQYSTTIECDADELEWYGDVQCHARVELVRECQFDMEEFEINDGCRLTASELADYYMTQEDVDDSTTLARAGSRTRSCRSVCTRRRRRCRKHEIGLCIVCRVVQRCLKPIVIM